MCTRFYLEPESEELREYNRLAARSPLAERFLRAGSPVVASGEVRPTNVVPVLAPNQNGLPTVYPMKWGFALGNRSPVVNARSETAAEKPAFKAAWQQHRCVIPASWYCEWQHFTRPDGRTVTGDKYAIQPRGANITYLCGLYRMNGVLPEFTVLTRAPTDALAELHDRMPVILPKDRVHSWLRPDSDPNVLLGCALTDMVVEKAAERTADADGDPN